MKMKMIHSLFLLFVLFIGCSRSDLGSSCRRNSDCKSLFGPSNVLYCEDHICKCHPYFELKYSSYGRLIPECDDFDFLSEMLKDDCNKTETSCEENAECVKMNFSSIYGGLRGKSRCRCKQGFVRVDKNCLEISKAAKDDCNQTSCGERGDCVELNPSSLHRPPMRGKKSCKCKDAYHPVRGECRDKFSQKPFESCAIPYSGPVPFCNASENVQCLNNQCVCTDVYYFNSSSEKCEPMSDYAAAFDLPSYRVKPGEYCSRSSHCIEGLDCRNFKCACPSPCSYDSTKEICDCGWVPVNVAVAPMILGIILGIAIMIFWCFMIKRTIAKYKKKPISQFTTVPETAEDDTDNGALSLSPVTSSSVANVASPPPVGLTFLPSKDNEMENPSAPPALTSDPLLPPQASLYGITSPQAPNSSPLLPPAYSEKPLDDDGVPSYSINPPPMEGTGPPLPYSSPLPYPPSPSVVPYGTNKTGAT